MIPHFDKRAKGGEDAYVSTEELLAVADGVGGWG
jgi:serine/threonine protein phosphatase PrpC